MGRKKKQEDDTDKDSYIGRRVEKNFEGFGKYAGSVVAHNAARGFYRIVYDDGDREELELHELESILVSAVDDAPPSGKRGRPPKEDPQVGEPDSKRRRKDSSSKQKTLSSKITDGRDSTRITRQRLSVHKQSLDENENDDGDVKGDACSSIEDRKNDAVGQLDVEGQPPSARSSKRKRQRQDPECASGAPPVMSTRASRQTGGGRSVRSQNLLQAFDDASDGHDSSDNKDGSDIDEYDETSSSDGDSTRAGPANVPYEPSLPPLVPLPPSSRSFPLSEDLVAEAFAVYSFLRSFSHALFLSPFSFDDFASALMAETANNLIDSIHLILLQALRRHLQRLSKDDCMKANECLRQLDWNLLDNITWPSFLMVFLATHGFGKTYGQRIGSLGLLDAEYYKAPRKVKLAVMSFLCDHALETEEIRAVLDVRELEFTSEDARYFSNKVTVVPEGQQVPVMKEHRMKAFDDTSKETSGLSSSGILNVETKSVQEEISPDWNSDECVLCGMNGNLICCDGCPAAYHSRCVGIARASLPPGDWFCPECIVEKVGGEQSRRMRGLEGCISLGVDPYGRAFMATCGHLLVLSPTDSTRFDYNYYNKHDIPHVLHTLEGQTPFCADVALAIRQYWNMPSEQVALPENSQLASEGTKAILYEGQANIELASEQPVVQGSNKTIITEHKNTGLDAPCPEVIVSSANEIPKGSESPRLAPKDMHVAEGFELSVVSEPSAKQISGAGYASQDQTPQHLPSGLDSTSKPHKRLTLCESKAAGPSLNNTATMPSKVVFTNISKPSEGTFEHTSEEALAVTPLCTQSQSMLIQSLAQDPYLAQKIVDRDSKGRFLTTSSREHVLSDTVHKFVTREPFHTDYLLRISSYTNHYVFGDAAATAAANLALMTADDAGPPEKDRRKLRKTGTTIAEQVNAFCKAPARFCWPSIRKKLMEAPKDRCGWCFSCTSCMKRGCLLNQAAAQLAAGAARVSGGIRPGKYGHGHLPAVVGYILYMEENLQSFLVGPWENMTFRRQWRKKIEQAMSICDVKAALLDLEANLRSVVLIEDWSKCLEDAPSMVLGGSSTSFADDLVSKKASGKKSSRRSGASRRGLPKSGSASLGYVQWARRGKLAHRIAGLATLSSKVVRKAGRQGGFKNLLGITYVDCQEVPRRSKQTAWRARVQAAQTVAELALQVRCLDCMLRWDDLSSKSEVHTTVKVSEEDGSEDDVTFGVHAKSIQDNLPMYLVDSTLVPRHNARQNASLSSLPQNCKAQHVWVEERQVPLHLLREFEEKERISKQSEAPKLSTLQRYLMEMKRVPKRDIFKFLWDRAGFSTPAKLVLSVTCKFCSSKVLASVAVQCHVCKDPFHKDCAGSSHSVGKVETKYTCRGCMKQLVGKKSTVPYAVKPDPALCLGMQKNENSQRAVNAPGHQKRFVISQPRPPPLVKLPLVKLSLKPSLNASALGSQGKEDLKREVSQASMGSSTDAASKNLEKSLSEGVYWRKNGTSSRMCFEGNMLFPSQEGQCKDLPKCYVCQQQFKGDLIYVKCEYCPLWFHGDAVGVNKGNVDEVVGFKCNRCRKKAVPSCPYGTNSRMHKRVGQGSLPPPNVSLPAVKDKSSLVQDVFTTKRSPIPFIRVGQNHIQQEMAQNLIPVGKAKMVTSKSSVESRPFVNGHPQPGSTDMFQQEYATRMTPWKDRQQLESHSLPSAEPVTSKILAESYPHVNGHPQPGSERLHKEYSTPMNPSKYSQQLESNSLPSSELETARILVKGHPQPGSESSQHSAEGITPSTPMVDTQLVEIEPTQISLLTPKQCIKEECFDRCLDVQRDIDCGLSEDDSQKLSDDHEPIVQDDVIDDGSINGESLAQPTLSFMELLSSEDNRVEELADVAMDFGADGLDVFDLDTILDNFESCPLSLEPLTGDAEVPEFENETAVGNVGATVGTIHEVCTVCNDCSLPFDLQCIGCGLAVHQHCLNLSQSGTGTWTSHGWWACDSCKPGILQSQDVVGNRVQLVDSRILLQS